jgi:hypothetical protein
MREYCNLGGKKDLEILKNLDIFQHTWMQKKKHSLYLYMYVHLLSPERLDGPKKVKFYDYLVKALAIFIK